MEILNRRNKREKPCVDYNSYDRYIIDQMLTKVGCSPPYFRNVSRSQPCLTIRTMQQLNNETPDYFYGTGQTENATLPCKEIVKIGIDSEVKHIDFADLFCS